MVGLLAGSTALASAVPLLNITEPHPDAFIASSAPVFEGTSDDTFDPITLSLYSGTATTGTLLQTPLVQFAPLSEAWEASTVSSLTDGQYTAVAEQVEGSEPASEASVTFTIDTTPPLVSLESINSPTSESTPTLRGAAGALPGDRPVVTVTIYEGAGTGGRVAWTATAPVSAQAWSYLAPHLADGAYTAQVTQEDEAGNVGESAPSTFTVDTTPPVVSLNVISEDGVVHVSRPAFSGHAGTATGDLSSIGVSIYAGSVVSGIPKQTLEATAAGGKWKSAAATFPLANGIYTAVAEQRDEAGNLGKSEPMTFAVETRSPTVTLETSQLTLRKGTAFTDATPRFSGSGGSEPEDGSSVAVKVYSGGSVVRTLTAPIEGSSWSTGPVAALPDGVYTAQAEQEDTDPLGQTGFSSLSTFTVDGDAPNVTLSSPGDGSSGSASSVPLAGGAGTAEGDSKLVTVQLFAGASVGEQSPLESVTMQAAGGSWSGAFGGLDPGTYTARAEQSDDVGNVGYSRPATFTVLAPVSTAQITTPTPLPPPAPVASFQWFPSAPVVGEPVSLVSTSADTGGSITAFAWSLTQSGPWLLGEHVLSTTFTTPGTHQVRLRVTAANGLTGEVTEAIPVNTPPLVLMQPFPVVRIAGSAGASGVKIMLFTVQAPVGAVVRVTCRGRGCPPRGQVFVVSASRRGQGGAGLVSFARFERSLKAGAVLEVRISKAGQIGKYTRFKIRHGKLPTRFDACLAPTGTAPIACPSS
jgi:hypothetical protein